MNPVTLEFDGSIVAASSPALAMQAVGIFGRRPNSRL
jgi:hypothetical protein